MKEHRNPALYRELSAPFPNRDALDTAFTAFTADLAELRKKHKIPNLIWMMQASALEGEEEVERASAGFLGNSSLSVLMAAALYGGERETHVAMVQKLLGTRRPAAD